MKKFWSSVIIVMAIMLFLIYEQFKPIGKYTETATNKITTKNSVAIYKNGVYTGSVTDAYYGNIRVRAVISGGVLSDVQFMDYPQDRETSVEINTRAMPLLKSEAIKIQSANVDTISGATQTSEAFRQSLVFALSQATL